uniref:Uncharacterized protein n=1 Tax=Anguilla anguilla TaxID=7936 RepID=A0A0E9TMQ4_ANGAN
MLYPKHCPVHIYLRITCTVPLFLLFLFHRSHLGCWEHSCKRHCDDTIHAHFWD